MRQPNLKVPVQLNAAAKDQHCQPYKGFENFIQQSIILNEYNKSMEARSKYNDVKFFLVAIAFISAFNYYLTWSNIKLNWFLLLTYTIDTAQGWLAWWAVRSMIIYMDKKLPYGDRPLKRILIKLV